MMARLPALREPAFRDLYEDQVFAAKICRTTPVYISGVCSYRYRQHQKEALRLLFYDS